MAKAAILRILNSPRCLEPRWVSSAVLVLIQVYNVETWSLLSLIRTSFLMTFNNSHTPSPYSSIQDSLPLPSHPGEFRMVWGWMAKSPQGTLFSVLDTRGLWSFKQVGPTCVDRGALPGSQPSPIANI